MPNYDDLFTSPQPEKAADNKQFAPFDKDAWAAQKQQDRADAFALIDATAQRMATDPALFMDYLNVQARFDRYSVGNAILVAAQRPDMTEPADAKAWKDKGVYVKKGESGVLVLEPGEEYQREDGSVGVSFNAKRIFDVSQTTSIRRKALIVSIDPRMLISALIHNAPCKIEISEKMPQNVMALYKPDDKVIRIRQGLDAPAIFSNLTQELAHAHSDKGEYKRSQNEFTAYCVGYVICKRYNLAADAFRIDKLPERFSTMNPQQIRSELAKIRDTANTISANMRQFLEKAKTEKHRDDGAR